MALLNIDTSNIPVAQALDPIPSGWYPIMFTESEMKPTNNGQGGYLEMVGEVTEGQYQGRKLWDRLNLQNANKTAVEIAYKTLSAICHAVNVIQVGDSAQLHNIPLMAKVALVPASVGADGKTYEAKNEVKGYKAMEHGTAAVSPPVSFPAPPVAPVAPAPAAAPWAQPAAPQVAPQPAAAPAPWAAPAAQQPAPQPVAPAPAAPPWAAPAAPPWAAPAAQPWAAPAAQPAQPAAAPWAAPAQGAPAAPPWAK